MSAPEFLDTLERTGLSTWIRESESAFAYYFVLVIHNIGLALLVGACCLPSSRAVAGEPAAQNRDHWAFRKPVSCGRTSSIRRGD